MCPDDHFRAWSLVLENPANIVSHRPITCSRAGQHVLGIPQGEGLGQDLGVLPRNGPLARACPLDEMLLLPIQDVQKVLHGVGRRLSLVRPKWIVRFRVERVGQRREGLFRPGRELGIDLGKEVQRHSGRASRDLRVEAVELHFLLMARIRVVIPHPADHVEDFFRVPGPEIQPCQRSRGISFTSQHELVDVEGFRHRGLDAEDGEPHLAHEELEHPVLELEELAGSVCRLAKCHQPRLTDHLLERLHVVETVARLHALETNRVLRQPFLDFLHLGLLGGQSLRVLIGRQ